MREVGEGKWGVGVKAPVTVLRYLTHSSSIRTNATHITTLSILFVSGALRAVGACEDECPSLALLHVLVGVKQQPRGAPFSSTFCIHYIDIHLFFLDQLGAERRTRKHGENKLFRESTEGKKKMKKAAGSVFSIILCCFL